MSEVNPDCEAEHELHAQVSERVPFRPEWHKDQDYNIREEAKNEGHGPLEQLNLALLGIRLRVLDVDLQTSKKVDAHADREDVADE